MFFLKCIHLPQVCELSKLLYDLLFVLSLRHKVMANSLPFQGCLIHLYLQDFPHFDFLILLNTFLCNFLLDFALAGNTYIHVSCYYQYWAGIVLNCIYILISGVLVFCRNSLLVFFYLLLSVTHIYRLIRVQFMATLKCFYYFSVYS